MKLWIIVLAGLGSGLIALGTWLRHRARQREEVQLDATIASNGAALASRQRGQVLDESLQARARARLEIIEKIDKRSAAIASGGSSARVLEIVKKQA